MATTTNYGWTTPDDTDLVKDGAAAIRTLGSSVDTTTKALNPETTTGDIAYRSATANTNTRLALGTAGQVLTVNSGATAPEWAAPAAGGMTELASGSLPTGAAVLTLSSISASYKDLRLVVRNPYPLPAAKFNNDSTANIYNNVALNLVTSTPTIQGERNSIALSNWQGTVTTEQSNAIMYNIYDYADTTAFKLWDSQSIAVQTSTNALAFSAFKGAYRSTSAIDRIDLSTGGGNFGGGTYILYGVK
jgi:hypothetical protein